MGSKNAVHARVFNLQVTFLGDFFQFTSLQKTCDEGDVLAVCPATIVLCSAVLTQIPKIGTRATDLRAGASLAPNFSRLHHIEIL